MNKKAEEWKKGFIEGLRHAKLKIEDKFETLIKDIEKQIEELKLQK